MHCLIRTIFAATLLALAAGSGIRPGIISISRADAVPLRRGYQEQDTARAFYSYGYSDENAAKAEYTARDGSSRGFYSYVDANGKLQTVKYEAGGRQGFKADATNLPKAPVDDRKPPLPVTDTAEVQQAREAHLSALREAEEMEARNANQREEAQREQESRNNERTLSAEDADILERVRAELTSMLEVRQREESRRDEDQNRKDNNAVRQESSARAQAERQQEDRGEQRSEQRQEQRASLREDQRQEQRSEQRAAEQRAAQQAELRAVQQAAQEADQRALLAAREQRQRDIDAGIRANANGNLNTNSDDVDDMRLRTVYTLEDISSSSYLKLADLEDRLDRLDSTSQDLRVPIGAYYSYVSPTTKYSVTTPTELRSLRPVALSRSLLLSKQNQN